MEARHLSTFESKSVLVNRSFNISFAAAPSLAARILGLSCSRLNTLVTTLMPRCPKKVRGQIVADPKVRDKLSHRISWLAFLTD